MFAHQRRALEREHGGRVGDRAERGIIDAAKLETVVEGRGARDDVAVGGRIGADDHLRRLAGGREAGGGLVALGGIARVDDRGLHIGHRTLDPRAVLLRGEPLQPAGGGKLDVDRDAVGIKAGKADELRISVGDRLEMDIAAEMMVLPQGAGDLHHLLHGIVGRADDARGEKQTLNIIALVEGNRQLHDFIRGEAGAADVRGLAVDAIMAVEDAAVGQQDLEQADTATVGRIGVADAHALGRAKPLAVAAVPLGGAGRRAGCVIFRSIGKDFELLPGVELRHSFDICSGGGRGKARREPGGVS